MQLAVPLTERNSAMNSLNGTHSKQNKSIDSKAKLLLVSEKDIYNYIAEENKIYEPLTARGKNY
jgi:hypothetical protein